MSHSPHEPRTTEQLRRLIPSVSTNLSLIEQAKADEELATKLHGIYRGIIYRYMMVISRQINRQRARLKLEEVDFCDFIFDKIEKEIFVTPDVLKNFIASYDPARGGFRRWIYGTLRNRVKQLLKQDSEKKRKTGICFVSQSDFVINQASTDTGAMHADKEIGLIDKRTALLGKTNADVPELAEAEWMDEAVKAVWKSCLNEVLVPLTESKVPFTNAQRIAFITFLKKIVDYVSSPNSLEPIHQLHVRPELFREVQSALNWTNQRVDYQLAGDGHVNSPYVGALRLFIRSFYAQIDIWLQVERAIEFPFLNGAPPSHQIDTWLYRVTQIDDSAERYAEYADIVGRNAAELIAELCKWVKECAQSLEDLLSEPS